MRAIVRKNRKRKADDPSQATTYRLRKRTVPPQRIERYMKDRHITNETAISEAGILKCNAASTLAKADIVLATPSDLSCESPRSLVLSDVPTNFHPLVPYERLEKGSNASDPQVLSMPASETSPRLLLSFQLCDQTSNANLLLDVPRLLKHAHSDRNACCSARKYVELLQPLLTMSCGDDPVTYNAASYEQTFHYHPMEFGSTDRKGTPGARLPVPEAHARSFGSHFAPWSNQGINRMIDVYEQIPNKNGDVDRLIVLIHRVLAKLCVEKTAFTPPWQTVVDTAGSCTLALGNRACGCYMCRSLSQSLTINMSIVAFCLRVLILATNHLTLSTSESNRPCRIAWLRAPISLIILRFLSEILKSKIGVL